MCFFFSDKSTRRISEGSCGTEDWNNNPENSPLRHRNKYILKGSYILLFMVQ